MQSMSNRLRYLLLISLSLHFMMQGHYNLAFAFVIMLGKWQIVKTDLENQPYASHKNSHGGNALLQSTAFPSVRERVFLIHDGGKKSTSGKRISQSFIHCSRRAITCSRRVRRVVELEIACPPSCHRIRSLTESLRSLSIFNCNYWPLLSRRSNQCTEPNQRSSPWHLPNLSICGPRSLHQPRKRRKWQILQVNPINFYHAMEAYINQYYSATR